MLKEGDIVTWGSGNPRAVVVCITNSFVEYGKRVDDGALVELTEDVTSPCGKVFAKGTQVDMPFSELRLVN